MADMWQQRLHVHESFLWGDSNISQDVPLGQSFCMIFGERIECFLCMQKEVARNVRHIQTAVYFTRRSRFLMNGLTVIGW